MLLLVDKFYDATCQRRFGSKGTNGTISCGNGGVGWERLSEKCDGRSTRIQKSNGSTRTVESLSEQSINWASGDRIDSFQFSVTLRKICLLLSIEQ